jgi:hypothetical protein
MTKCDVGCSQLFLFEISMGFLLAALVQYGLHIVLALRAVHIQHTHTQTRNETCDINNHKITQLILEKHTIKLDFIHHNDLMHINTYRLGSMTRVNMDASQEVLKI